MKFTRVSLSVFVLSLMLALGSCSLLGLGKEDEEEANAVIDITGVGHVVETIAPDYWIAWVPGDPTIFMNCFVYFDKTFTYSDLEYVKLHSAQTGTTWNLDITKFEPDYSSTRSRLARRIHLSADPESMPIGSWTAEAKLKNGNMDSSTFTLGRPGSVATGSYQYATTKTILPSGYIKALEIPTISGQTIDRDNDTLSITISVNDPRVVNGYVWFYATNGDYLGWSGWARDPSTGHYVPALNNNADAIYADGSANSLELAASFFALETGNFDHIASCRVVLTDGQQYEGPDQYDWYDYRAISNLAIFP